MSVRRYGHGQRQIVYLHGLGEAGDIFTALFEHPELRNGDYTHIVPDLPGYGRSQWPVSASGLSALADLLTSWIAGISEAPTVVGHSMGGVLAVLIAEKSPGLVKSIVNFEGNVSLGDCAFSARIAAWPESEYAISGHDEVAARIYALGANSQPERFYYAELRLADPMSTHRHARELVDISTAESMATRMAALAVPCAFVAGVPDGIARRSLELLDAAGVMTVRVEPAGHWVHFDQPTACARVIAQLS